ncbi:BZ3500_MvSof-1268-A1-R1_Chr1-3g01862 [Microbotryum saponariae]|uniref:BZ3500_MvSof-1268-A1-R1_Chr1-3g01862 protein n=1 Tax=Microbotryum saponariae TaxID=289078 RepID=A0A2X0M8B8_9BASI|nr:BZ3500_MvSof-1268-A1-R1_Chr1-3g01862 [Microbotryum saponariae]SCZ94756.1 BZ3501_MvSof-1269-A2-R1_Chr1-3g01464 [Microbotryum saponariae]
MVIMTAECACELIELIPAGILHCLIHPIDPGRDVISSGNGNSDHHVEIPRFLTIQDRARDASQSVLHEPLHDWIILGYEGTRETLHLIDQGRGGLGVVEMRSSITPNDVNFGLLKVEGRILLWTYMPEHAISGVRRGAQFSLARCNNYQKHDATFTASRVAEFTPQITRYKLKLDRALPPNTSSPPTPAYHSPKSSPEITPRPPLGMRLASDDSDSRSVAEPRSSNSSSRKEQCSDIYKAMIGLDMSDPDRSPPSAARDRSNQPPPSRSQTPRSEVDGMLRDQIPYASYAQKNRTQSSSTRPSPQGPPPPSRSQPRFDPTQCYPSPPASADRHAPSRHQPVSSRSSIETATEERTAILYEIEHASPSRYSPTEYSASVYGGQAEDTYSIRHQPPARSISNHSINSSTLVEEEGGRESSEEARRREERERFERELAIKSLREKREEEAKLRAREVVEKEHQARIEYEQRQKEREAWVLKAKKEREEKMRLVELERRRKEEEVRREEQRRVEEDQRKRLQDAATRVQKDQERLLMSQHALFKKLQDDEEALVRAQEKKKRQHELKVRFAQGKMTSAAIGGTAILDGEVSVQGGNSIVWRRRWFELRADELVLFKSAAERSRIKAIAYKGIVKVVNSPEEAGVANSFMLTLDDGDDWTFFTDESAAKDVLLSALEVAAGM